MVQVQVLVRVDFHVIREAVFAGELLPADFTLQVLPHVDPHVDCTVFFEAELLPTEPAEKGFLVDVAPHVQDGLLPIWFWFFIGSGHHHQLSLLLQEDQIFLLNGAELLLFFYFDTYRVWFLVVFADLLRF